jgi:hypothetical protein
MSMCLSESNQLNFRLRKEIWDPVGKEMGLPARAVEDAIWAMGPDEIASRANHGPFLINPQNTRTSRSPTSAVPTGQTPTPTTPGGTIRPSEELGIGKRRRASTQGRRSRTQSTSLGSSSAFILPPLKEGPGEERKAVKSERDGEIEKTARADTDVDMESETRIDRDRWYAEAAPKTDSPIARAASREEDVTKA